MPTDVAGSTAAATSPPRAPAPAAPSARAAHGDDFAAEVALLHRIGACGNDAPLAAPLPRKVIDRHCAAMKRRYASYKRAWSDRAGTFIAALRPADLPPVAVYPFGGGDLSSALTVFPDASEITTLSLEAAGDIRGIAAVPPRRLGEDLTSIGHDIGRLYQAAHSTTKTLQSAARSSVPGTIMFALAALAVHGHEPLSLRYFDIEPDGSLRYLTGAELDDRVRAALAADAPPPAPGAARRKPPRKKPGKGTVYRAWKLQESIFANAEITYRPAADPAAPPRTYRHIVANLDDEHLGADGRVLAHLERKGKVAVMTKAASFLLWYDDFSLIRQYLIDHLAWMISDASGIPPRYAEPAGLEQITYGTFVDAYFIKDPNNVRAEMKRLWKRNPPRDLPFRFGYPDAEEHPHLMVTRRR